MGSGAACRTGLGPPSAAGTDRDPRPHFALNVIHLLRGEFAEAWNTHPEVSTRTRRHCPGQRVDRRICVARRSRRRPMHIL